MKYKDAESLKKNRDFQLVYKTGTSYVNKYLVMYAKENQLGKNRIGISVSKKVGNSVVPVSYTHRKMRKNRELWELSKMYTHHIHHLSTSYPHPVDNLRKPCVQAVQRCA